MQRLRQSLLVFSMLLVGVANLFGDYCNTVNGVAVCWKFPLQAFNGITNYTAAQCSSSATSPCGDFFTNTAGTGWSSINGLVGWHNFDPTLYTAQAYLNQIAGNGFITLSSTSSLHTGASTQYLNPSNDNGYYLSTADSTTTPGLTINFSSDPIKSFAMYWGSVDQWNTIIFTDANCSQNCTHTVSGPQLSNFTNYFNANGNNTTTILVQFSVPPSSSGTANPPWSKVAFSSCGNGVCQPAFEFDNIEWVVAPSTCCSVTTGSAAPVPESSSLILLWTGAATVAGWLRHKARM